MSGADSQLPIIAFLRWDEKAGLRRDAIRSQWIDALKGAIERRPAVNKSSTVTMSGNEILKRKKLTIGMDLGDRSTRYCVLDEAGDVILERSVRFETPASRTSSLVLR